MPAGPGRRYGLLVTCLVTLAAVPVYIVVRAGTAALDRYGALPATRPFLVPGRPAPEVPVPATPPPAPSPTATGTRPPGPPASRPPAPAPHRPGTGETGGPPPAGYVSTWTWRPPATGGGTGTTGSWSWSVPHSQAKGGPSTAAWPADGSLVPVPADSVPAALRSP